MEELSSTVDMSKQPELMQRMSKVRSLRNIIDLIHMKSISVQPGFLTSFALSVFHA